MTRTKVTKLDMKTPSEPFGKAFISDGSNNVVMSGFATEGHLHSGVYSPTVHTHIESQITDLQHDAVEIQNRPVSAAAPIVGDAIRWAGSQWIPSGVASLVVQEYDSTIVSNVTAINFEGAQDVINESNGKVTVVISGGAGGSTSFLGLTDTPDSYTGQAGKHVAVKSDLTGLEFVTASGGEGGGSLTVKDEGITVLASATTLDFKGSQITATASGSTAIITVSGVIVDAPAFMGARIHLKSNWALTVNGWEHLYPFGAQSDSTVVAYDQGDFYREGAADDWWRGTFFIPEDGYYKISGQVSFLTSYSGSNNMKVGLWKNDFNLLMVEDIEGPKTTSGVPFTLRFETDAYLLKADPTISDWDDNLRLKIIRTDDAPNMVVVSGYNKTFWQIHKIAPTITVTQQSLTVTSATRVYRSSDASNLLDAGGAWTNVPFQAENADPSKGYDTNNYWSSGDDTKFYFPTSGYYHIVAQISFEQNDQGIREVRILKGGSAEMAYDTVAPISNSVKQARAITESFLGTNDYIQIQARLVGGASPNRTVKGNGNGSYTFVTINRIGMP